MSRKYRIRGNEFEENLDLNSLNKPWDDSITIAPSLTATTRPQEKTLDVARPPAQIKSIMNAKKISMKLSKKKPIVAPKPVY